MIRQIMITLINVPGLKSFSGLQMHTPNPPLGLAYLAAAVRDAGFDVSVVDAAGSALDQIRTYPERSDFMIQGLTPAEIVARIPSSAEVIGIGCMFSSQWPLTRIIAHEIRKHFPHALLVGGGEHATAVPEHTLRNSPLDVLVLGEGEETFVRLVQWRGDRGRWKDIPGLAFRDGDGRFVTNGLSARNCNIDELPLPAWDLFPMEEYIARHQTNGVNLGRSMPLIATRGCPYQCTFCSNPDMWTTRYVPRDPVKVVDEIEHWMDRYRVTNFDFQDLTAIVKRQWAIDFCNELIQRNLDVTWQMPSGTRSEVFDEEVADLLYKSGCRALAFAPESGSPEILKSVKKRVDLEQMLRAIRITLKRGFRLSCFIVIGFPGDNRETLKASLRLVRELALLGLWDVAVTKFIPYPGSALFKQLQEQGKLELDDEFFHSPMDFYVKEADSYCDAFTSRQLYWWMIWMFTNFYVISFVARPFRVLRVLYKAATTGVEETRYAKWFVDRFFTRRKWRRLNPDSSASA